MVLKFFEIIKRILLIRILSVLQSTYLLQGDHLKIPGEVGAGCRETGCRREKSTISLKQSKTLSVVNLECLAYTTLLMGFHLVPRLINDDLE